MLVGISKASLEAAAAAVVKMSIEEAMLPTTVHLVVVQIVPNASDNQAIIARIFASGVAR